MELVLPTRTHHDGYPSTSPLQISRYIPGSRDPWLGCRVGNGSSRLCPRWVRWGSSCWRVIFGGSINPSSSSKLAKPPLFSAPGGGQEPALALLRLLPVLLPRVPAPGKVTKGRHLEPQPSPGAAQGRQGQQNLPGAPCPPRGTGFEGKRLFAASNICWEPQCWAGGGLGWPDVCAQLGDGVPTPLSHSQPLSSCFNPKTGPSVPPARRRCGGGCSALGRLLGWIQRVFIPLISASFSPKKGAGWALLRPFIPLLGATCSVPKVLEQPGASRDSLAPVSPSIPAGPVRHR